MRGLMAALFLSSVLLGVTATMVVADEGGPDSCAIDCPEGQVRSSFLDGEGVSCTCMEPGPGMTDDSEVMYGGDGEINPDNPS